MTIEYAPLSQREHFLVCEICDEYLARFWESDLCRPLNGGMFRPLDEGFTLPWPHPASSATWEAMRCPYCRHRPMVREDTVMTGRGHYMIPIEDVELDQTLARVSDQSIALLDEWDEIGSLPPIPGAQTTAVGEGDQGSVAALSPSQQADLVAKPSPAKVSVSKPKPKPKPKAKAKAKGKTSISKRPGGVSSGSNKRK